MVSFFGGLGLEEVFVIIGGYRFDGYFVFVFLSLSKLNYVLCFDSFGVFYLFILRMLLVGSRRLVDTRSV